MKRDWRVALLVLSGLAPLLGLLRRPPDPMLLIYTAFAGACLFRRRLTALVERLPGPVALHLLALFLCAGALTETLAWANNYLRAAEEPALFHPQLFADLIVGVGFYGGWAAAWWIALRRFRFKLWEAFVIAGLQGVFLEQSGAVFLRMVHAWAANPLLSLALGLYVFAVHGSAVGLAAAPLIDRFAAPEKSRSWLRFPAVVALMVGLAFAGTLVAQAAASLLGGLPPKRSIVEHPFW
ncbi:MAG: hypothetical protein J7M29_00670 [Verrucomicrobia bacterium]|nr:hypothetical protein [Verrucomicrobiota bacterium]